jgi:putative endonuclease
MAENSPKNRTNTGRQGENRAATFLETKNMRILARNFRSRRGEIDIIALDGETVVFVEVKTWKSYGIEELRFGLSPEKQRRIIETAKYFLASHREYKSKAVRFDVIFIGTDVKPAMPDITPALPDEKEPVTHLVSAFMESV